MRNVVFVAPFFVETTLRFASAVTHLEGVRVGLVSQQSLDRLPADLRSSFAAHWRLDDPLDPHQLATGVQGIAAMLGSEVDRLLGILEQLQVPLAEVRQALGIPGMDTETARNFRDKARMKTVLQAAGVPCARHRLCGSPEEALDFASSVGFPLVVKPPAGAGARATFRVEDTGALGQALAVHQPTAGQPVLLEQFLTGKEGSFDSISLDGTTVWHSFSHYFPTPLEVLEHPWIQWCVILPRRIDTPLYRKVEAVGERALRALGLETGLAHLEWFLLEDGTVAVSEVGARPPGAQITSMLSYAHDMDIYRAWAGVMVHGEFERPERRYAVGTAFLRGQGRGRVHALHGIERAHRELGDLVVEAKLPRVGQPQGSGYEGEGYVILRHPETAVVEEALKRLITQIRVEIAP